MQKKTDRKYFSVAERRKKFAIYDLSLGSRNFFRVICNLLN